MLQRTLILGSILLITSGCGVKGKPLPPLQQPFISSGNYQEDFQKKQKDKKKSSSETTPPTVNQENSTNEHP